MQLPVYNLNGEVVSQVDVNDLVFGIEPNHAVMHQALVRQHANARAGTHDTLRRGEVRGGGKKPWRQKGTGRARQGSIRSPQFRGGGIVFGPHPRSYEQAMPKKMRRLAVRSVLSQKVREGRLLIVTGLGGIEPRTKAMKAVFGALNVGADGTLVAIRERNDNVERAGGNLERTRVILASNLNIADMLKYDWLVLTDDSLEPVQTVLLDGVRQKTAGESFIVTAAPLEQPAKPDANAEEVTDVTV